jgi:VWFA-related protein
MAQSKGLSNRKNMGRSHWIFIAGMIVALGTAALHAQSAESQTQPQSSNAAQSGTQSSQPQSQADQGIPDAPSTVQPPPAQGQLPQPTNPSHPVVPPQSESNTSSSSGATQPPPKMPPVKTLPAGTIPRNQLTNQEGVYKLPTVSVGQVLVPVTVKYSSDGRLVEGLGPKNFTILDNGRKITLNYFTSDPFELSVAVVLDLGTHQVTLQQVYDSFGSLVGAFSPYDEFALYTYSGTVIQQLGFTNNGQSFEDALNQIKLYPGRNNGPQPLNDPFSMPGPMVNSVPVNGPPIAPVQTPTREGHVLNDAILRAGLDLGTRDKNRRKVILVISDGQELGSEASYKDVLRVLETRNIQVQAVVVGGGAMPIWKQVGKFHLKTQGFWDLLPRYTKATGGGQINAELTRNSIEDAYARITSDVRNQYTLGYAIRSTPSSMYHSIDVIVDRGGLKVYAKQGYYPAPNAR